MAKKVNRVTTETKSISMSKSVLSLIEIQCEKENRTFSNMVEFMCIEYLKNQK